jgi:hypothetical protein
MSKKHHSEKIEIQKGPINLDGQYNGNFQREPEKTMRDIMENQMRMDYRTLTLHEPKR